MNFETSGNRLGIYAKDGVLLINDMTNNMTLLQRQFGKDSRFGNTMLFSLFRRVANRWKKYLQVESIS
mgnify:CR=1 FL=1